MPSANALSQVGASPSGHQVGEEEFDSEDIKAVYSEEDLATVELEVTQGNIRVKPIVEESHPGEGILLKNPRSKVTNDELTMLRYLFKIHKVLKSEPQRLMRELIESYMVG